MQPACLLHYSSLYFSIIIGMQRYVNAFLRFIFYSPISLCACSSSVRQILYLSCRKKIHTQQIKQTSSPPKTGREPKISNVLHSRTLEAPSGAPPTLSFPRKTDTVYIYTTPFSSRQECCQYEIQIAPASNLSWRVRDKYASISPHSKW